MTENARKCPPLPNCVSYVCSEAKLRDRKGVRHGLSILKKSSPNFSSSSFVKALTNEDTLLRTHCCRHKCFPFACARNICCGHKFCVRDTKNVSDFVQKHFMSATNVSQFAQHVNTIFILCPARVRAQEAS